MSQSTATRMPDLRLTLGCAFTLTACIVLGGSTRSGFLADAVLQLASLPLLIWASLRLLQLSPGQWPAHALLAVALCCSIVLLHVLHLLPLPPSLWTALPLRNLSVEPLEAAGIELGWRPLSMAPEATLLALLSLVPAVALFLGTMLLGYSSRRALCLVLVACGLVSSILGLLQVSQGAGSGLRPFGSGDANPAVGFFANRNHLALLLSCVLLFVGPCLALAGRGKAHFGQSQSARGLADHELVAGIVGFVLALLLVLGVLLTRSRAGVALVTVALIALVPIYSSTRSAGIGRFKAAAIVGIGIIAAIASETALVGVLERFVIKAPDGRVTLVNTTLEAARAFLPLGAGIGSFVGIYPFFESTSQLVDAYANRAHNDVVEFLLEGGAVGAALLVAIAAWLIARAVAVWRNDLPRADQIDHAVARAASLAVLLIAAHSLFDYPLRTGAMSAVLAVCCALMMTPLAPVFDRATGSGSRKRTAPQMAGAALSPVLAQGAAAAGSRREEPAVGQPQPLRPPTLGGVELNIPQPRAQPPPVAAPPAAGGGKAPLQPPKPGDGSAAAAGAPGAQPQPPPLPAWPAPPSSAAPQPQAPGPPSGAAPDPRSPAGHSRPEKPRPGQGLEDFVWPEAWRKPPDGGQR